MAEVLELPKRRSSLAVDPKALRSFERLLSAAGWEVIALDIDLAAQAQLSMHVQRHDGLSIMAKIDKLGRSSIERSIVTRQLKMDPRVKGRAPLSPQVDEVFLGRASFKAPSLMVEWLSSYLADNALGPLPLVYVRSKLKLISGTHPCVA